ncbi:tight adherence protein B [Allocatelliglobosispora scoriae]|uniref:Tight adherence protein B n=1 Tax=Allocatelliglobosispora scoriae TaxID=643052 RepID=A0A841BSW7_9ACTN|nr:hypothetical protein [Allocatelliglobosispora scoriae]MBB5871314.1 tight adherence protein B [Allocatelliglobosispora scoriae]
MLTGSTRRLRRILPSAAPVGGARRLALSGRVVTVAVVGVGSLVGGLLGGPVATVVAAAYLGTAAYLVHRTRRDAAAQRRFGAALDTLADGAAALRAGLVTTDLSLVEDEVLRAQAWSALSLSERTGAPLAELLERIETQHRLAIRSAARAGSEAAGAATTAVLLAALPIGGVALGYVLGVNPARILLHTPLGAGCAIGAILLQLGGLAWVMRLVRPPRSDPTARVLAAGARRPADLRGPGTARPGHASPERSPLSRSRT